MSSDAAFFPPAAGNTGQRCRVIKIEKVPSSSCWVRLLQSSKALKKNSDILTNVDIKSIKQK